MQGLFTSRKGTKFLGGHIFTKARTGAQSSFSPDVFAGMKLWLDASFGVYSDGAARFDPASTAYLSSSASALATSGPMTWVGWFYIETTSTGARTLFGKYDSTNSNREWLLRAIDSELNIIASNDGNATQLNLNFGAVSTGQWFFIAVRYDGNMALHVYLNSTLFQFTLSSRIFNGTGTFKIGAFDTSSQLLDGRADSVAKYSRALNDQEIAALYNGGVGLVYADLSNSQKTNLVSWWDLDEASGTRFDSNGTNDLTSNNVTSIQGIVAGTATHGDPVKRWVSRNNLGTEIIQNTYSSRPTYQMATGYGILFDGVDDILKGSFLSNQPCTVYMMVKQVSWTNGDYLMDGSALNSGAIYQSGSSPKLFAAAQTSGLTNNLLATSNKGLITFVLSGAAGSVLVVNGSGAVTGDLGSGNLGGLTLGASAASGNFGNILVNEIIVFNSGHTESGRAQVRGYFSSRYAIPMA
jgi:hypothetical protein